MLEKSPKHTDVRNAGAKTLFGPEEQSAEAYVAASQHQGFEMDNIEVGEEILE